MEKSMDGSADASPSPSGSEEITRVARISPCGRYRYSLERLWGAPSKLVTWIMLNPSTADAQKDDPTIRRCIGFSKAWGFTGLVVVNLFAWRSTDPTDMKRAIHPVGPENDAEIKYYARASEKIICAWGSHGEFQNRGHQVLEMLSGFPTFALRCTLRGEPAHPLYLPAKMKPFPYSSGAKPAEASDAEQSHPVTSKLPTTPEGKP